MLNGTAIHAEPEHSFHQVATLEQLMAFWPFVKAGIDRIKHRDKSCGHWTHNQVFNAIKYGLPNAMPKTTSVELFMALDRENKPCGFLVTTPRLDPFLNNVPVGIHVWLLYADFDMIVEFLPELERLGRIHGGDQIRFESGRVGWLGRCGKLVTQLFEKGRMGRLGFRIHQFVFVKDIQW